MAFNNEQVLSQIVHPLEKAVFKSMREDMATGKALLNPEQLGTFLRAATLNQTILRDAQFDILQSFEKEYTQTGINGRVLQSGYKSDGKTTNDNLNGADVDFDYTKLSTSKLKAMCSIQDDEKEDNITKEQFEQILLTMMGERVGEDLEVWALYSDTTISYATDDLLCTQDGWLKNAAHKLKSQGIITAAGSGTADFDPVTDTVVSMFDAMIYAMPLRFRQRANLKFYVPFEVEDAYRNYLASRGTSLGDVNTTGFTSLEYKGIPIINCQSFDNEAVRTQFNKGDAILTNPAYLKYGIWKNLTIEPDRKVPNERTDYYYRMRGGINTVFKGVPSVTASVTLTELEEMPDAARP